MPIGTWPYRSNLFSKTGNLLAQMLTGKSFRLRVETFGIEGTDAKKTAVLVPKDNTVRVISSPSPDDERMADVEWNGRKLAMFAVDIQTRGEEINSGALAKSTAE